MAQYNSKHTGSQIDSAVARALAGGSIDQDIAKKMDATESTDYPGCYYKVNNGVKEWINPPMVTGTEYHTTERYLGKPVYVKSLSMGNMPAISTTKTVAFGTGTEIAIEVTGRMKYESDTYTIPFDRGDGTYAKIYAHSSQVCLMNGEQSLSSYNVFATVKYIKTTD